MKPWHEHLSGLDHHQRSTEFYGDVTVGIKTKDVGFAHVFQHYHHPQIEEARKHSPKGFPSYLISDNVQYKAKGRQHVSLRIQFTATQKYVEPQQIAFYLKQDSILWAPIEVCRFHHWTLLINGHHRFAAAFIRGDRTVMANVSEVIPFSGKLPRF